MRRFISILFTVILSASIATHIEAQSLMQTAKKAEQRAKELKQQETSRYNAIIDSRDLGKYNKYIADYPSGKNTPEIKRRVEELKLWNTANSSNTIEGYENYLNRTKYHWYDGDAISAIRSLKQKAEKLVWDKVVAVNTIDAYEQYLQQNPNSGFRLHAEKAINRLKGTIEWQKINGTNDIAELQRFISIYPHAAEVKDATLRLHELKGIQFYNEGNLRSAYTEFSKTSRHNISYANQKAYDEVMEYHEFTDLGKFPSETSLLAFMRKYPNSKYTAQWKRKRNGGTVNFGLDFMDWGYNCESGDGTIMYYNVGLLLRIGNYRDRVQFAFGLKPGMICYDDFSYKSEYYYSYETTEMQTGFHMPIIGQLKLNLFNTSENSRFFIYGQYQYNAVRIEDVESEMSWCAGLGVAWKHFDWSFYYRQDIGRPNNWEYEKQKYIAMSLIYYWQL